MKSNIITSTELVEQIYKELKKCTETENDIIETVANIVLKNKVTFNVEDEDCTFTQITN